MKVQYRKKPGKTVVAVQLDPDTEGFTYQKCGWTQVCKPGDWLVNNGGETRKVDQQTFAETYDEVGPGIYSTTTTARAVLANGAGEVVAKEGSTKYQAGHDSYAVSRRKFLPAYEPVDP